MTLEQALQENTKAVNELIGTLKAISLSAPIASVLSKALTEGVKESPKAEAVKEEVKTVKEAPKAEAKPEAKAEAAKEAPAKLDYTKDVKPLVVRVLKEKDRDTVVDILSRFGVAKATDLDEKKWPDLVEALNEALEETEEA